MKPVRKLKIALVGADSFRGKELKIVFNQKNFPLTCMDFYDPDIKESYSKLTQFQGEPKVVEPFKVDSLEGKDLAFLATSRGRSRRIAAYAEKAGCRVIDLSEAFNRNRKVPLAVSGVNESAVLAEQAGLIANPHPVTIILAHLLHAIREDFGFKRGLAVVMQPASAFDEAGVEELAGQSVELLNGSSLSMKTFKAQVAFNLLPQTETLDKNGFSPREKQIVSELKRVLEIKDLGFSLSLVQAPVFHGYSLMVYFEIERDAEAVELETRLRGSRFFQIAAPGVSSPASSVAAAGQDRIFVGQIKREKAFSNGFWIWLAADNLTRGSALNAFEIAEAIAFSGGAKR